MKQPLFSILITSYNRPQYLPESVESLLKNDFKDFEILISDDHSERIEEIKKAILPYLSYQNVNFFQQPKNLGMFDNWNFLMSKARGEFVLGMGDDDKIHPEALGRLKGYIEKYPEYDLYSFGYEIIDENGRFYYLHRAPKQFELSLKQPKFIKSLFFSDIIPFWAFHSFTICYRREMGQEIRYVKEAANGADLLFLFQCLNKGKRILVIPEVLFSWRKMQGKNKKDYQNFSGPPINNVIARKNILHLLYQSRELDPDIQKFIFTFSYRKHFLYDPIINDGLASGVTLAKLDLEKKYLDELTNYNKQKVLPFYRLKLKLRNVLNYTKLFGPKGFFCAILFFYQKFIYKFKNP